MRFGQCFQVFEMAKRVVVENNAWVEDIIWIESVFYFEHDIVSLFAPFALYKWRHIAACAMFGFERTIIFINNQINYFIHHIVVSFNFLLRVKRLIDNKMKVPFECMAVNYSIIVIIFFENDA